jgi:NAD(P)-dependent dehydrogenase (short-subunit alcohol dehydrogenase family)
MTELGAGAPTEFAKKVVVVTGASAGIGRAIARAFALGGANLVLAARNFDATTDVAAAIERDTGSQALAVRADVSLADECRKLIDAAVGRFGSIDILVNNAAYFALVPLLDAGPENASQFLQTNLCGPLFCGQAMARWVIANRRSGVIVNISSISGVRPAPGCGLYSASKAALDSLTKSMALEWTKKGIRVNGVAPGHVNTEGVRADFAAGRLDRERMFRAIPAGRVAEVEDIAEATVFLASERSRHIVGATLTVDGGEGL